MPSTDHVRESAQPPQLSDHERGLLSLLVIRACFQTRTPSLDEIATHLGMKSKGSAARLIAGMIRRKLVARNDTRAFGSRSGELVLVDMFKTAHMHQVGQG